MRRRVVTGLRELSGQYRSWMAVHRRRMVVQRVRHLHCPVRGKAMLGESQ
jgi:hypothetical protein